MSAPRARAVSANYVMAIDQGTTSSRAAIVSAGGEIVAMAQREHAQLLPQAGWVEHDPLEVWQNVQAVMGEALASAGLAAADIAALGITNQRETTIVWDRLSGRPVHPAIVWQDTRTQHIVDRLAEEGGVDRFRRSTGLPLAGYFSASKIAWILENVPGTRERAERGELLFGTMDSWLVWNLTGGVDGGLHLTDVSNASRTLLMDLAGLSWQPEIARAFGIPLGMLPRIASSSELYGMVTEGPLSGVAVAGILGDQQAAAFGQAAFARGDVKNTYGTGNFMLANTGTEIVHSTNGLIATVAYRLGDRPASYALEGSVAVTGSLIQWLRDNIGLIASAEEVEGLALSVDDNGGAYLVPAFSGLFAPHWRPDARGVLVGLTRFVNRGHIARAALESIAFQSAEVLAAMQADIGMELGELRVDGGAAANRLLMQIQASVVGIPVVRPTVIETSALGAAYVAGLAVGFWSSLDEVRANWREGERWMPQLPDQERERMLRGWSKAVQRTLDSVD